VSLKSREEKMADYKSFELNLDNGVADLKLGNAKFKNALTKDFFVEFPAAIRALDQSGAVRALVLHSEGTHFCSGIDLNFFADETLINTSSPAARESFRRLVLAMQESCSILNTVRFPVLVACQGAVIGAAVDLVSACDLRFATSDSYFVIQEINIGLMADLGSLQRLPLALPDAIVRQMAFTGAPLAPQKAEQLGFVNQVYEGHEQMLEDVFRIARTIADRSPLAVAASKLALNYNHGRTVEDALANAAVTQAAIFDPAAVMASVKAMKSKSKAEYADLSCDSKL
jgi:enoyl-CoA hydratase